MQGLLHVVPVKMTSDAPSKQIRQLETQNGPRWLDNSCAGHSLYRRVRRRLTPRFYAAAVKEASRSKRSAFITLVQTATKSFTNFSLESLAA